jgi:hypothetical protein
MELSAHDVVIVPSKNRDAVSGLPVPNTDGLVIGSRDDPRMLMVEVHSANVIDVPKEVEQATPLLVVPDLDLVIISTGHKEGLGVVECNSSHRT